MSTGPEFARARVCAGAQARTRPIHRGLSDGRVTLMFEDIALGGAVDCGIKAGRWGVV
ncbi:hypothetical protein GCM10009811_26210 [Nostocoides veronense]|uniref:Uncharacterized protein n=1 Tax=Nostocoides veronense TaxID=330836 RepID=A0ABN2LWD9_9MICO